MDYVGSCELCLQTESDSCERAKKDDIVSWSEGTLKALHVSEIFSAFPRHYFDMSAVLINQCTILNLELQDLLLCGLCVEDIKVVGNSLNIVNGWNGKITVDVAAELSRDEGRETLCDIKEESEVGADYSPVQEAVEPYETAAEVTR